MKRGSCCGHSSKRPARWVRETELQCGPAIPPRGVYPRETKTNPCKNSNMDVSNTIHNSPRVETTHTSINRQMGNRVVCPNKAAHTTEGESSREKEPILTWLKLENIVNTRIQSQKTGHMISFTGNVQNRWITEVESGGEVAEEEGTGPGCARVGRLFWDRPSPIWFNRRKRAHGNDLELNNDDVSQLCKYAKNCWLVPFKNMDGIIWVL